MKNTPSASATLVPLRRRLTGALLVLGLTLGTIAITASPVDAAGVVVTCFQRVGPNPWFVDGFPVKLQAWNGVQWEQIGFSQVTDQYGINGLSYGCTSFVVPFPYQDKLLRTILEQVGASGRYYFGYSYDSAFYWPPHNTWYPMTIFGNEYTPVGPVRLPRGPYLDPLWDVSMSAVISGPAYTLLTAREEP